MLTIEDQIRELTDELDAMDRDGRFESERDRYHQIMVRRTDLMHELRKANDSEESQP